MAFPPRELALTLPASALAGHLLLQVLARWRQDKRPFHFQDALPPGGRTDEELRIAYAEGWGWLIREGLIVPDQNPSLMGEPIHMVPSRRARELDSQAAFDRLARGGLLPNQLLDERIRLVAEADFFAGETDTAVFKALREVEIAVRHASNLSEEFYGVVLMQKAFNSKDGVLRLRSVQSSENDALPQLFASSFALYSNTVRHKAVDLPAAKAVEVLVLASHLLRIVDEQRAALNSGNKS